MAFGSGSSSATDRWIMRWGSPFSEKLLKGWAAPPGSTSTRPGSPLPTPDSHRPPPSAGRASFFPFVQGVGGGDPAFAPLPAYPEQARKSGPDGLARDPPLGEPLLKATSAAIESVHRLVS